MRVLSCFATLAVLLAGQTAFADVRITEVMSTANAPLGSSLDQRDWWELTNSGPGSASLNGYTWEDSPLSVGGTDRATFPNGITVAAGESIIILQSTGASNAADFRTAWNLPNSVQVLDDTLFSGPNIFSGLSSSGDEVNLFNAANVLVDNATFGASAAGVSFEWSNTNVGLGLSVAGENGAYQITYPAPNPTSMKAIGSPGSSVSVPEPAAIVLLVMGLCGLSGVRRRK